MLGCHADRNNNPSMKAHWERIAKKFNGLGLSSISMASGVLVLVFYTPKEALAQCALCNWIYVESVVVSTIAPALATAGWLI
ncbi:DUF3693 domain-containing protein [Vibrio ichthyoenteri]